MDRDKILKSIRNNIPELIPLPKATDFVSQQDKKDLQETMKLSLKQAGADYKELDIIDQKELAQYIESNYPNAVDFTKKHICDEYPSDCSKDKLNLLGTVILSGQFGVAENGAI